MEVVLLDFVETALRVAKQALGKRAGKPARVGLAREAHIVAHCIRKEEGYSYAELIDRLSLMPEICNRLGLHLDALPDPTAFYHSLDRYTMHVWRALLRVSAQQHPSLDTSRWTARSLNGSKPLSTTSSDVGEV
jgi:hypothetical protein